jgi:hypothetical protein
MATEINPNIVSPISSSPQPVELATLSLSVSTTDNSAPKP